YIEFSDVSKSFGPHCVLDHVNFYVIPAETLCILGRSGVGKSVSLHTIMVFQNGALFDSLTVGENVAFPLREQRDLDEKQIYQVVDGLLDMVGVKAMRELLPSDLSTGMKRSV